jgi:uncharacterized UBP type Zn finger protein
MLPDQTQIINDLAALGFTESQARTALQRTRGGGVEAAANWLFEHADSEDLEEAVRASTSSVPLAEVALGLPASGLPFVINPDSSTSALVMDRGMEWKVNGMSAFRGRKADASLCRSGH